jgi:hypothetical protein
LYRFLKAKKTKPHKIYFRQSPSGQGDAKQFVRTQHVAEVAAMRARPHLAAGVISMLDADDASVAARKEELDDALQAAGQGRRQPDERIGVVVPRRNIETWIHSLLGVQVDETTRYPRFRGDERQCAPAAQAFAQRCPNDMRSDDLPSLRDACAELTAFLKKA